MKMTPKEKQFATAIVDGHSATFAYVQATGCENRETAKRQGCRWLARPAIQAEIMRQREVLQAASDKAGLVDRMEKRQKLTDIIRSKTCSARDRIKAIEVDNLMTGENAPQKVEVFGTVQLLAMIRQKARGA